MIYHASRHHHDFSKLRGRKPRSLPSCSQPPSDPVRGTVWPRGPCSRWYWQNLVWKKGLWCLWALFCQNLALKLRMAWRTEVGIRWLHEQINDMIWYDHYITQYITRYITQYITQYMIKHISICFVMCCCWCWIKPIRPWRLMANAQWRYSAQRLVFLNAGDSQNAAALFLHQCNNQWAL